MADKALQLSPIGRRNPALRHLKYEVEDERFLRIFADFARIIRRLEKDYEEATKSNPEYADFVGESAGEHLEELIGSSFLVLQGKIRRVLEAAERLRKFSKEQFGLALSFDRLSLIALDGNYKRKHASLIRLIWDVANYYKHRDEWSHAIWTDTKKDQSRKTRRSVQRVGISQFSTGNMRKAYEFFEVAPYSECEKMANRVQTWANHVYKAAEDELKTATAKKNARP